MQRLGSQVLANAGSVHGTAVAEAGEWRLARPFQVQVPAVAIRRQLLPSSRAAIPEARAVATELVARIDLGHRLHARQGGCPWPQKASHCASLTSRAPAHQAAHGSDAAIWGHAAAAGQRARKPRKFGGKVLISFMVMRLSLRMLVSLFIPPSARRG